MAEIATVAVAGISVASSVAALGIATLNIFSDRR